MASWESAYIYPLFSDPSEGRSYPDLGSIPGPFLLHNYQPVAFSGTTISKSKFTRGIWGSAHIYPLFTDPSYGRSYPNLGSIPGPSPWHNYQPVRIYGWHHWDQPISIRYSPIRLRAAVYDCGTPWTFLLPFLFAPTLILGASQVHFSGTVFSRAEYMFGADLSVIQ